MMILREVYPYELEVDTAKSHTIVATVAALTANPSPVTNADYILGL